MNLQMRNRSLLKKIILTDYAGLKDYIYKFYYKFNQFPSDIHFNEYYFEKFGLLLKSLKKLKINDNMFKSIINIIMGILLLIEIKFDVDEEFKAKLEESNLIK